MRTRIQAVAFLSCLFLSFQAAAADVRSVAYDINIPAQNLNDALQALAIASQHKLLYSSELVDGKSSPAVKGIYTTEQAVRQLLSGTNLTYEVADGLVLIRSKDDKQSPPTALEEEKGTSDILRIAQAEDEESKSSSGEEQKPETSYRASNDSLEEVEEIVVTGTHIRNATPLSPIVTITHEDFINQGYTRLDQALEQLPQNFKGGVSSDSNPNNQLGSGSATNYSFASGVNLRGLGATATLILLDGRRVPPSAFGDQVDISKIPVSLIEKVEILKEGASATYGADAVAGVVNIITRKQFEGVEIGSRIGSISKGKAANYGGNVLYGQQWGTGNFILNYDYEKANPLFARNRSFTATIPDRHTLLPEQETSTVYGSLRQEVSDRLSLSGDVIYAERDPSVWSSLFSEFGHENVHARQVGANVQASVALPANWQATVVGQHSQERDTRHIDEFTDSSVSEISSVTDVAFRNEHNGVEARVDGALFQTKSGPVRLALGGAARREEFETSGTNITTGTADSERKLNSIYGELLVPLIGAQSETRFVGELTLDLAGRFDDYSDFGSTFNPKFALQWSPASGIMVNASYGRSFLAPPLYYLSRAINNAFYLNVPDPELGTRTTLFVDGTNPDLNPQRSTAYNFGIAFHPAALPDFSASLNYFDIKFTDKVERLSALNYIFNVITNADELGAFVNLTPTLAQVNDELNVPGRTINNFAGPDGTADQVGAIAYVGYVNAAVVRPKGIDASATYRFATQSGHVDVDLSGSYFLSYKQQITVATPQFSALDTTYNPLKFRAKTTVGWESGPWRAYARINHSNSYRNPSDLSCPGTSGCKVSDWTTLDVGASISTNISQRQARAWDGLRIGIDVSNLFDEAPPYAFSETGNNYDPTNASPLLRSIGLTLIKKW